MTNELAPADIATTVRASVVVAVPIDHAFKVFTSEMSAWWPATHHISKVPMAAAILEPRVGGRWYEVGDDGTVCLWGMVLAYDPPRHVAVSWHLDGDFTYDSAPAHASRVDVWFSEQPDGSTLVELVHSGLANHGPSWTRLRDSVAGGWPTLLKLFDSKVTSVS